MQSVFTYLPACCITHYNNITTVSLDIYTRSKKINFEFKKGVGITIKSKETSS